MAAPGMDNADMTDPAPAATSDYAAVVPLPVGAAGIRMRGETLVGLDFLPPGTPARAAREPSARRVSEAIQVYLADPRRGFDLPLDLAGTPFRMRVWRQLRDIPPGQTRTYGQIAHALGSSPRAVGQAVGDNPIPIIVPCHRVIAADGGLGGFNHSRTGYSLDIKRWLLGHEGVL